QQRLDHAAWKAFDRGTDTQVRWLIAKQTEKLPTGRLSTVVSHIAERVYTHAPRIPNEVINRQQLTSQGASARRTLMEAMVTHSAHSDLNIDGYGPEKTIYV